MTNLANNEIAEQENFVELFENSIKGATSFNEKIVKGKVINLDKGCAVIDVGLKSEGRVDVSEFKDMEGNLTEVNIGDSVEVFVERYEDKEGMINLSREKAIREEAWYQLEEVCKEGKSVEGLITKRVKGGFMAIVKNVAAFLPGSQIDFKSMKNINGLVGTTQMFKILTTNRKRYNVVISRKLLIEEDLIKEGKSISSNFEEGQIVDGVVKNITGYGAFMDLGLIDGLLHVTDISWSRVNHPSEALTLGETIKVKIIKVHPETGRISLGIKQLSKDPWAEVESKHQVRSQIKVKVTNITDYGIFVEIEKGVEGLIHISEISWGKSGSDFAKNYSIGDEIEAVLVDIDVKKRRISLSIKQGTNNPLVDYVSKHPIDSTVDVKIKSVNEYGIVVDLGQGTEGFIKASDIAWGAVNDQIISSYRDLVGTSIKAKVIKFDSERDKINFGIKQIMDDPFVDAQEKFKKGSVVKAKVVNIKDEGLEVELDQQIKGFIKKLDLSFDSEGKKVSDYKVSDEVEAVIVGIDGRNSVFSLSMKALDQLEQKKYLSKQDAKTSDKLGDILDQAMKEEQK